jgi:hypothetical protein
MEDGGWLDKYQEGGVAKTDATRTSPALNYRSVEDSARIEREKELARRKTSVGPQSKPSVAMKQAAEERYAQQKRNEKYKKAAEYAQVIGAGLEVAAPFTGPLAPIVGGAGTITSAGSSAYLSGRDVADENYGSALMNAGFGGLGVAGYTPVARATNIRGVNVANAANAADYVSDVAGTYNAYDEYGKNYAQKLTDVKQRIDPDKLKDAYGFLERRQFVKGLQKKRLVGEEFNITDLNYAARSTDKTNSLTKLVLDRDATFYRGVKGSVPEDGIGYQDYTGHKFNMSEPAGYNKISEFDNMKNAGVDFNDPMSIAEYQATYVPMQQYGYRSGMPNLNNVDAIYTSKSPYYPNLSSGYGNYQMKLNLPRDYSKGNYSDWINRYYKPENNLDILGSTENGQNWNKDFIPNASPENPVTLSRTNRDTFIGLKGEKLLEADKSFPYIDYKNLSGDKLLKYKNYLEKLSKDYNTGFRGQYKNGGWLDKYNDGGPVQPNYNDYSVSAPEGFEGDGYSNVGRDYSPAWGGQFKDGGKVCDSCQKAEDGDKLSARRKAVLAKAEQVFNSKDLPYTIPEDIVKSGGNSNYVCIQGVCGILTDAGIIPKDYYTNTKFAEKAPGMGFGRAMADLKLMKPGDVLQHMSDTNPEGTRFPSHAEIFKDINSAGDYEFYDYFDKFNGLGNIRTYNKEELEDRFNRFKNRDNSGIQAQFFSLDPEELPKIAPRPFPYDLPNKKQEDYFNATHAADTKYYPGEAAQGPISDIDSYKRSLMKNELAGLFNDKKLDEQLRRELKISDQDLQKAKPLIYGIMDQESDFGNPKSLKRDIKYGLKELLGSGSYSMGPAAVRYDDALSSQTKQAFGIDSPHDLSSTKNAYIGALDVLHKGSLYTDDKVSGHPGIQDKDSMERALYWYNNPKNIVNSDAQTFQDISKEANNLFPWQDRQDIMRKAYNSPLEMSEGSYPDKVLQQSKGLHQVINFDDMNILPEVQVKDRRIYNEEPFKDGGSVKRFMQPTETFKNYGYNPKENGMSTELSTSIGGPGEVYLVPGYRQGRILQDPEGVFNAYGEHLGGPFKTVKAAEEFRELRHKYVEKNQNIPAPIKTRDYAMGGEILQVQNDTQSSTDSVRHQANKILQYEQLRGGPGGAPLPQYKDPKYMNMLMENVYPEVKKIMPNASAIESGEAMDFIFNAGWDKTNNKISKDPRAFALQEYYKQNDSSKLDKDGKWSGRKNAPYSFDQEYSSTIGKLPENERRLLMNKGRDWYYQNTAPKGSTWDLKTQGAHPDYKDTWYGRIWNTNDYKSFDPNNPKFTPKKEMGGSIPGAVGFTYARTNDPAPSNGKYAKKTMASAQNGAEMKFYQEGLDFKPKTISKDGSQLVKLDQLTNFTNYNTKQPGGWLDKYQ